MQSSCDVVVIGGGPSGMMAACTAARTGVSVCLLEHTDRLGAKLLVTGNGRCNCTNTSPPPLLARQFNAHHSILRQVFRQFGPSDLIRFFEERGVALHAPDGFHVFPRSNKASDILQALQSELTGLGVTVCLESHIKRIEHTQKKITGVHTTDGPVRCSRVILATGGKSYPRLGSDGTGFALAQAVGHSLTSPVPGLVALTTRETWPATCAGLSLPDTICRLVVPSEKPVRTQGALLFTHSGVSGPAILDISARISRALIDHSSIRLFLVPDRTMTAQTWNEIFISWHSGNGTALVRNLLGNHLPSRFASWITDHFGVWSTRAADLSKSTRKQLVQALSEGIPLTITGTAGFQKAMITGGGISLDQLNQQRLESKHCEGLFFSGEILDIDGPCGGFNLQWAFSSGVLAGTAAGKPLT